MSATEKQKFPYLGRTAEVRALDAILDAKDMTIRSFAPLVGIPNSTLAASISKGVPEIRYRHRIEAALGWIPVWSSPRSVELRRQCFLSLSFDPCLLDVPELRQKISMHAIRITSAKYREESIEEILLHVELNPPAPYAQNPTK